MIIDPDHVPETLCDGRFYINIVNGMSTLVFAQARPNPDKMINENKLEYNEVVRTRLVLTIENLAALRDLAGRVIESYEESNKLKVGSAKGADVKH